MELSANFNELTFEEMENVDGGGPVAAVYALGFVMGVSPMAALVICGGTAIAAVAGGWAVSHYL